MAPILTSHHRLHPRADSVHDPAVWVSLIFISIIFAWLVISLFICPCFFDKHGCQPQGWNVFFVAIGTYCCKCRPRPEEMARERDFWAEGRLREELRERSRRTGEGVLYHTPHGVLETDRSVVDVEVAHEGEPLPQYKPRTDIREREGLNEGLAANDETEIPINEQPRPYDEIMIVEPPPAYVEPRTRIM